jgi:chromosome segregation ATPase
MDFDSLLRGAQFLFTVVVGFFSWSSARKASSKVEAEALAKRLSGQDNRLLVLEQQMKHLPTSEQLTALAAKLAELGGDMKGIKSDISGINRSLDPLNRSVDRLNDFLLHNK